MLKHAGSLHTHLYADPLEKRYAGAHEWPCPLFEGGKLMDPWLPRFNQEVEVSIFEADGPIFQTEVMGTLFGRHQSLAPWPFLIWVAVDNPSQPERTGTEPLTSDIVAVSTVYEDKRVKAGIAISVPYSLVLTRSAAGRGFGVHDNRKPYEKGTRFMALSSDWLRIEKMRFAAAMVPAEA